MCLITDQLEPLTAGEGIHVIKVLDYKRNSIFAKSIFSIDFYYHFGKLYKETLKLSDGYCPFDKEDRITLDREIPNWENVDNIISIGSGLHSVGSIKRAMLDYRPFLGEEKHFYNAIIPKGALYYKNPSNLYVSNQLIVNKEIL